MRGGSRDPEGMKETGTQCKADLGIGRREDHGAGIECLFLYADDHTVRCFFPLSLCDSGARARAIAKGSGRWALWLRDGRTADCCYSCRFSQRQPKSTTMSKTVRSNDHLCFTAIAAGQKCAEKFDNRDKTEKRLQLLAAVVLLLLGFLLLLPLRTPAKAYQGSLWRRVEARPVRAINTQVAFYDPSKHRHVHQYFSLTFFHYDIIIQLIDMYLSKCAICVPLSRVNPM